MSGAQSAGKRKRIVLSLRQKCEVLTKLESGVHPQEIMKEFNIGKSTLSDIKKNAARIWAAELSSEVGPSFARKTFKQPRNVQIDEALFKWYKERRAAGDNVTGAHMKIVATRLAQRFNIPDFKASEGWLWRFRLRHGLKHPRVQDESTSADVESASPFQRYLKSLITNMGLSSNQIYNADETGLFWKALPCNTQAFQRGSSIQDQQIKEEKLSALLCSNSDGSHQLTPVIVSRSDLSPDEKNEIDSLPVHYYCSEDCCFDQDIFKDWFFEHFVKEVRNFQMNTLNIQEKDTQALLLLDDAPAHLSIDELRTDIGSIQCLFFPPNMTSFLQPMNQGIIEVTKRLYRRKYLEDVLTVFGKSEGNVEQRGEEILAVIKTYNIKSAICNWSKAWKDVKVSTLAKAWKKLLTNTDSNPDYEGLDTEDFLRFLKARGEDLVALSDVEEWLEADSADPGSQIPKEEEEVNIPIEEEYMHYPIEEEEEVIIPKEEVVIVKEEKEEEEINIPLEVEDVHFPTEEEVNIPKEEMIIVKKEKEAVSMPAEESGTSSLGLSQVREMVDHLIHFVDNSDDSEVKAFDQSFRRFRQIIIKKQQSNAQ